MYVNFILNYLSSSCAKGNITPLFTDTPMHLTTGTCSEHLVQNVFLIPPHSFRPLVHFIFFFFLTEVEEFHFISLCLTIHWPLLLGLRVISVSFLKNQSNFYILVSMFPQSELLYQFPLYHIYFYIMKPTRSVTRENISRWKVITSAEREYETVRDRDVSKSLFSMKNCLCHVTVDQIIITIIWN